MITRRPLSLIALLTFLLRPAVGQEVEIERIVFFGSEGIDTERVSEALPIREGDTVSVATDTDAWKRSIVESVRETTGNAPTDVSPVCCGEEGGMLVYIGLPGSSSHAVSFNRPPGRSEHVPAEFATLYDEIDAAVREAVIAGRAGEDDSAGYALASDFPPLRDKQLEVRRYALANESAIYDVLRSSSDPKHRAMAAFAAGYAERSDEQIQALVSASFDADRGVRNDAIRALGVILRADPGVGARIPAERFVELLGSGMFEDRNKASFVLLALTASRDPALLDMIESRARTPLLEMADWPPGHSGPALLILGRIAGIEEERLFELLNAGRRDVILRELAAAR